MNNIYFNVFDVAGDLYAFLSYKNDGKAELCFEPEDSDRIEKLSEFHMYEMQEGIFQMPSNLTKEQIVELLSKQEGFVQYTEKEKSINNDVSSSPVCKGCGKTPSELPYYVDTAEVDECHPDDIAREDGTYNPRINKFYCFSCYIKAGMPLGRVRE